jgi:anti-anti-sigma factor
VIRPFTVTTDHLAGGVVRVAVVGDLDMDTGGILEVLIANALAGRRILHLVVDLDAVDFLDAHGIRALVTARADARDHGATFGIENPHGVVRRVLQITGVLDHAVVLGGVTAVATGRPGSRLSR